MLIRHPQAVKVIRDNIHAGVQAHGNNAITSLVFLYARREWAGAVLTPFAALFVAGKWYRLSNVGTFLFSDCSLCFLPAHKIS